MDYDYSIFRRPVSNYICNKESVSETETQRLRSREAHTLLNVSAISTDQRGGEIRQSITRLYIRQTRS